MGNQDALVVIDISYISQLRTALSILLPDDELNISDDEMLQHISILGLDTFMQSLSEDAVILTELAKQMDKHIRGY